jgi:long-subunit acyl-CoA synthetase (AMP-forming)
VGPPQPAFSLRLEAIPELGYDPMAVPPRGEVLVKGDGLFEAYYKNEASPSRQGRGEAMLGRKCMPRLLPCC